jgi:hypothetical protein
MRAENIITKPENKIQEFQLLKLQFEKKDISEEYCYNAFQYVLELFEAKDTLLNKINLRSEILEILLMIRELHEDVYDRIVEDFSTMIVKIIK